MPTRKNGSPAPLKVLSKTSKPSKQSLRPMPKAKATGGNSGKIKSVNNTAQITDVYGVKAPKKQK